MRSVTKRLIDEIDECLSIEIAAQIGQEHLERSLGIMLCIIDRAMWAHDQVGVPQSGDDLGKGSSG
jgi:hypothetical protein